MNTQKSDNKFIKYLKEHIYFLLKSCDEYDKGVVIEAKRMSVSIRVLLHDTKNSTSLLKHLNKKNILFYDTAYEYDPKNLLPTMALISTKIGPNGIKYIPHLNIFNFGKGKIPFDDWWNQIIINDINQNKLSRKDIILSMVNTDGGAHVDSELVDSYYDVTRLNTLGFETLKGEPIKDPELATTRQITYEVLKTLRDEYPSYFV